MEKGNLKLLVYKYTQPKMLCTEKPPTSTQINGQGQKIERQLEASDVRSRAYNIFQSNCISFFDEMHPETRTRINRISSRAA